MVMSTWRVYFGCLTCPPQLVRVGEVIEQITYDKQLYPVREKMLPFHRNGLVSVNVVLIAWIWVLHQPREHGNTQGKIIVKNKAKLNLQLRFTTNKNKKSNQTIKPNQRHSLWHHKRY